MLSVRRVLQLLPLAAVVWVVIGASVTFRPDVGRRDPRGFGIGLGLWAAVVSINGAITPPLWMSITGAAGLVAALLLFQWAVLSIRGRLFSFAGNDDLPQFVHASGPYAYVRNPCYVSYLLIEMFTVVMWPSVWGLAVVLSMVGYYEWLARYEEQKFERSPVAAEYAQYKARTGRLVPRIWR